MKALESGYKFQIAPRPVKEKERMTMFVAGESGAGKSYFVRKYAEAYNKMFPKNPIYLISYLDQDETLDEFKKIIRLNAFDQDFLDECLDWKLDEEFPNCLVIFDDIDSVVNKKTKEKIYGLLNKMLRIGRHHGISVAYAGHELYASNELKQVLNESMTITIFPKFLNFKKLKYLMEVYLGLSKEQIAKIRTIRDRSVTYVKGADKLILSDTQCYILK
jgi:RecA-family ATPase